MLYRPVVTPRQSAAAQALRRARENLSRHAQPDTGINLSRPRGFRPADFQPAQAAVPEDVPPPDSAPVPEPGRLVELEAPLSERAAVQVEDVVRVACWLYDMSRAELLAHGPRTAPRVHARHVALYVAKHLTKCSDANLGRRFGGCDHTSVLHGTAKIAWLIGERDGVLLRSLKTLRFTDETPVDCDLREEVETFISLVLAYAALERPATKNPPL